AAWSGPRTRRPGARRSSRAGAPGGPRRTSGRHTTADGPRPTKRPVTRAPNGPPAGAVLPWGPDALCPPAALCPPVVGAEPPPSRAPARPPVVAGLARRVPHRGRRGGLGPRGDDHQRGRGPPHRFGAGLPRLAGLHG